MDWFDSVLILAIISTVAAVRVVGFSRRWKNNAMDFLKREFGEGPNDDEVAEEARQYAGKMWLTVATVAWLLVAALQGTGSYYP